MATNTDPPFHERRKEDFSIAVQLAGLNANLTNLIKALDAHVISTATKFEKVDKEHSKLRETMDTVNVKLLSWAGVCGIAVVGMQLYSTFIK